MTKIGQIKTISGRQKKRIPSKSFIQSKHISQIQSLQYLTFQLKMPRGVFTVVDGVAMVLNTVDGVKPKQDSIDFERGFWRNYLLRPTSAATSQTVSV
jgi:hypothetical protein